MPRISLWSSGQKNADYKFTDRNVSEWFGASGTAVYLHKYLGPHDQSEDQSQPDLPPTTIQDMLFLENRDRRYSPDVIELRGVYNVNDADFDLRQFGLFLQNDTVFLTLHYNDMITMVGRKIMPGDVVEMPHLRDPHPLDPSTPAMNKFYVVEDTNWASEGYAPTWWAHVWRLKLVPMHDAQEYADILDRNQKDPFGFTTQTPLRDIMSTVAKDLEINEAVVEMARESVMKRNFETQHFYVVPGDELTGQLPWVFAGDGIPPNGAELVGSGNQFPISPVEGDYYLRTDYQPHTLFRRMSGKWRIQEQDYRQTEWTSAHRILLGFIQNTANTTLQDGTVQAQKQGISKVVKPGADF